MIVKASRNDAPTIKAIAEKSWNATYRTILSPVQYTYMIEKFYALPALLRTMEEQEFLLFMRSGDPVAFAAYQVDCPEGGACKVHKLYVLPEAQGIGAGRLLLQEIAHLAIAKNCTQLVLNVNKHNKALAFYQHIGFSIAKDEVIPIGEGFVMDDYVLIKNLTPPL